MPETDHPFDIIATLPSRTTEAQLLACKEAGMTWVRVHSEKMTTSEAAALILKCHRLGLRCSYDTNGKKPRVRQSECMYLVTSGREQGNWLKELSTGEQLQLIPQDAPQEPNGIRLSYLPQVFKGGEHLNFADGKIVCQVEEVIKEGNQTTRLVVSVQLVRDTEGLYWKMGANSDTTDIYSGDDPALTDSDCKSLKDLKLFLGKDEPDEIAISFVSSSRQIIDAQNKISGLGFHSPTIGKIETTRGVDNIDAIVKYTNVEVARGDLQEACLLAGRSMQAAQVSIVQAALQAQRKVIIATHVADSALEGIRNNNFSGRLTKAERVDIYYDLTSAHGVMLAAETMTTRELALSVIQATNRHIQAAKRLLSWQKQISQPM